MNIIDIVILLIVGISVAYGLYKGFLHSLLNLACGLLSIILAFTFSPKLAEALSNNPGLSSTLAGYMDSSLQVGADLKNLQVAGLEDNTVRLIMDEHVNLPVSIENALEDNLISKTLESKGAHTVNDYVSSTVVGIAISILCFILCYIGAHLILSLIVSIVSHVFKLPLLKQMDWLAGGVLGLLRGALLLYVLFLALPLVSTIISIEPVQALIDESTLAPIFQSDGLFARVIGSL